MWSMPEHFDIYIVYKRHYINTLPFLFPKSESAQLAKLSRNIIRLADFRRTWACAVDSMKRVGPMMVYIH